MRWACRRLIRGDHGAVKGPAMGIEAGSARGTRRGTGLTRAASNHWNRPLLFAHLEDALPCRLARLARGERQFLDAASGRDRGMVQHGERPPRVVAGARAPQRDSTRHCHRERQPTHDSLQCAPLWRPCGVRCARGRQPPFAFASAVPEKGATEYQAVRSQTTAVRPEVARFWTPVRAADHADAAALAGSAAADGMWTTRRSPYRRSLLTTGPSSRPCRARPSRSRGPSSRR